ncbi:MAG: VWA domain-containing protein [Verrucomicrobia bacterium]|nr:VWA domain-containing protein [Verrucomicrobiota bacterium]MCH8514237.1 VWA domain-containing protein [Kiritimatiellia bacterium]
MFKDLAAKLRHYRRNGLKTMKAREMDAKIHRCLRDADNADQYFVKQSQGEWVKTLGGVSFLTTKTMGENLNAISGTRLQACDPKGNDLSLETQTQYDLHQAVKGVRSIRKEVPGAGGAVFGKGQGFVRNGRGGKCSSRVVYGLTIPNSKKQLEETLAAKSCYRRIKQSIRRSGLKVLEPKKFEYSSGMVGLETWTQSVKLGKLIRWPWYLLLLLLLFFIPTCVRENGSALARDLPRVETSGYLLILDKSGSMDTVLDLARDYKINMIQDLRPAGMTRRRVQYINVITYNHEAESALGGLRPLNHDTAEELNHFLRSQQASGGTVLLEAMQQAAHEVQSYGSPTTIHIVTDAIDGSIPVLLENVEDLKQSFGGIPVTIHATSPRSIFEPSVSEKGPSNPFEQQLDELVRHFNGRFGK